MTYRYLSDPNISTSSFGTGFSYRFFSLVKTRYSCVPGLPNRYVPTGYPCPWSSDPSELLVEKYIWWRRLIRSSWRRLRSRLFESWFLPLKAKRSSQGRSRSTTLWRLLRCLVDWMAHPFSAWKEVRLCDLERRPAGYSWGFSVMCLTLFWSFVCGAILIIKKTVIYRLSKHFHFKFETIGLHHLSYVKPSNQKQRVTKLETESYLLSS